jgi:hypothetical protein
VTDSTAANFTAAGSMVAGSMVAGSMVAGSMVAGSMVAGSMVAIIINPSVWRSILNTPLFLRLWHYCWIDKCQKSKVRGEFAEN